MLLLNIEYVPGKEIEALGMVKGTVVTVLLMVGLIALMLYGFALEEDAPPAPLVAVLVAIPGVVIFGVLLAVAQRFREIEKGEADDARQY